MKISKPGLVDTNLLVYVVDLDSSYHSKSKKFLEGGLSEKKLFLTPQVVLELYNVISSPKLTRPLKTPAIKKTLNFFLNQKNFPYIFPKEDTFRKAVRMAFRAKCFGRQKIFDAYLVATCLDNQVRCIYTHNPKDFFPYKKISPIDPL